MKSPILLAVLVTGFFACKSPTIIENSWRDPGVTIQNPSVHKIVVAALLTDQGVRRQVEDYMVSLYPGHAVQSYLVIGADSIPANEDAYYAQKLSANGFDGMVIMKQINATTTQHYVPGQAPTYYNTWGRLLGKRLGLWLGRMGRLWWMGWGLL